MRFFPHFLYTAHHCAAWVRCPVAAAKVAQEAGWEGWTTARVEALLSRPLQCYRCLELGHTRQRCTAPEDRSGLCYCCSLPALGTGQRGALRSPSACYVRALGDSRGTALEGGRVLLHLRRKRRRRARGAEGVASPPNDLRKGGWGSNTALT